MPPVWERDEIIYMDFRWKGRRYRPSTGMEITDANRTLAKQWDAAIQREITLGIFRMENHFPNYRPAGYRRLNGDAFKAVATAWLESHKNSWAPWTYRKFKTDLESRVYAKIGHIKIADFTGKDLRLLREAIIGEGKVDGGKLSNRSINRIMQPVKAIFNELAADGDIQFNPATRLGKLKEKRISEIEPFADEEIRAILRAIAPWYQPCADFGFEFGGRLEDIFGVKWANVNFVTETLSIREARTLGQDKEPKTEAAIRDVDITAGMLRALTKQKTKSYLAGGYVFVTETGKPIDGNNFRRLIWGTGAPEGWSQISLPLSNEAHVRDENDSYRARPTLDCEPNGNVFGNALQDLRSLFPQKSFVTLCPINRLIHKQTG